MIEYVKENGVLIFAVAFIVVVIVLIGAAVIGSIPKLTEGVVVDKTYQAASTDITSTTNDDGTTIRSVTYPAAWKIKVYGIDKDGKPRAEWWEVGSGLYEMIDIDDRVYRDGHTGLIGISNKR